MKLNVDFNRYKPKQVYTFTVDVSTDGMADEVKKRISNSVSKIDVLKTPISTIDDGLMGYGLYWRTVPFQNIDSRKLTITFEETDDMLISQYIGEKMAGYKNSVLTLFSNYNFDITLHVYNEYKITNNENNEYTYEYKALLIDFQQPQFNRTGNVDKIDVTATFYCVPVLGVEQYNETIKRRMAILDGAMKGQRPIYSPPVIADEDKNKILKQDNTINKINTKIAGFNSIKRGSMEDTYEYRLNQYKKLGGRYARAYVDVSDTAGIDSNAQRQMMNDVVKYMNESGLDRSDIGDVTQAMENMNLIRSTYEASAGGVCATMTGIALEVVGGGMNYKAHGHGGQWQDTLQSGNVGTKKFSVVNGTEKDLIEAFNKLEKDKTKIYVTSDSYDRYGHVSYTYWDKKRNSWESRSDFKQKSVVSNSIGSKAITRGAIYELSVDDTKKLL